MRGKRGAGGLVETHVRDDAAAEKSGDAAARAIEKLVRNQEIERRQIFAQRADSADGNNSLGAEHFQSADVRAVVDFARREAMAAAVARQERDALPFERADHDRIGGIAERRLHADFARVGEAGHVVEPAAADDGDL